MADSSGFTKPRTSAEGKKESCACLFWRWLPFSTYDNVAGVLRDASVRAFVLFVLRLHRCGVISVLFGKGMSCESVEIS